MSTTGAPDGQPGQVAPGRLSRDAALSLLQRGADLLAAGEFADAAAHYSRVVGFDDPAITGAALLGLGEARYRLNDEDGALGTWSAILELPENPSTYAAWRNVAAARVRAGDNRGAIAAYREADKRAPAEDKAEIASRLGWLSKETGDSRASGRYFARARGDGPLVSATLVVIAVTTIVSLTAMYSSDGEEIYRWLQLDKPAVAAGEYWRLWSVTLLHVDLLHLAFNMYALYLMGTIVERWYGSIRFLLFYLACAAGGSTASFVFGGDIPAVGASGAVFGMLGVLIAAGRLHHPVDRQARGLVGQLVVLLVINIVFGFASGGNIDNAAHLGGLAAGLWLGALVPPTRVPTLSSLWQQPARSGSVAGVATAPGYVLYLALAVVGVVVVAGIVVGTAQRTAAGPDHPPALAAIERSRQPRAPSAGWSVAGAPGVMVAVAGGSGNGAAMAASSDR